jgi:hypothetical protein
MDMPCILYEKKKKTFILVICRTRSIAEAFSMTGLSAARTDVHFKLTGGWTIINPSASHFAKLK